MLQSQVHIQAVREGYDPTRGIMHEASPGATPFGSTRWSRIARTSIARSSASSSASRYILGISLFAMMAFADFTHSLQKSR
ncbi:hypothetical protein [Phreatobacter sp.]|uniref:hypothetical protein n=1 Tax=Phreatobacter sp. TaxID=1966341 RepID=UPI00345D6AA1